MLVASCPACGRPCPLSVAEPHRLSCSACGLDRETPPAVRSALSAAAAILGRDAAETRQLGRRARRLLASAGRKVLASVALAWAVFLVPACLALLGGVLLLGQEQPSVGLFLFTLAPALVAFVATRAATRAVSRARADLELAAAAVPPPVPGSPARCRVCGAPLATGDGAIARCGYCQADNAVAPGLVAKAAAVKARARTDVEAAVSEAAGDVGRAARRAAVAAVAASLGSPIASGASVVAVAFALAAIPTAERTDLRYAVVEGPAGPCLALVTAYRDHVRVSYGGSATLGFEDRPSAAGLTLVPASSLTGQRVRSPDRPELTGEVVRIRGALDGTNVAVVRTPSGAAVETAPEGLCLVGR